MNNVDVFEQPTSIGDEVLMLWEQSSPQRGIVVGLTKCDYKVQKLGTDHIIRKSGSKLVNITTITNEKMGKVLASLLSIKSL